MSINGARRRQAGLTLIELIVFIMIMLIAVGAVMTVYAYTSGRSADPLQRKQAMLIAEALLDEVSLAHFTYCHPDDANADTAPSSAGCASLPETVGPRGSDARPFFNINDYVSAMGVPTPFAVSDATGAANAALSQYKTMLTISRVPVFGPPGMQIGGAPDPANPANGDVLHISVEVSYGAERIVLDRYRTRYAPNSMP